MDGLLYERMFVLEDERRETVDFKIKVRGGNWKRDRAGFVFDGIRGEAMRVNRLSG